MFKLTPVTSKIGQGHPSSNLTKTLLRYIHGISLSPMWLIFVELSCLQAKCWRTDRQTDRQTDGHANLIVGLVTRNPPKNVIYLCLIFGLPWYIVPIYALGCIFNLVFFFFQYCVFGYQINLVIFWRCYPIIYINHGRIGINTAFWGDCGLIYRLGTLK